MGGSHPSQGEIMPRYVAFLRGVSPMNADMPELKRAFEAAGFTDVKTVLSSGNVGFSARTTSEAALARRICPKPARRSVHEVYREDVRQ